MDLQSSIRAHALVIALESSHFGLGQELRARTGATVVEAASCVSGGSVVYIGSVWPEHRLRNRVVWIHATTAGVDALITGWRGDVLMTRTVGAMPRRIGEYVLAQILAQSQQLHRARRNQLGHRWQPYVPSLLRGTCALVVGVGEIGLGVAELLSAVGIETYGLATRARQRPPLRQVAAALTQLGATRFDWVIAALPSTPQTRHFFGADLLESLAGAFFINVGRGDVVDLPVLAQALERGWITGAALDVVPLEPWGPVDLIWDHDHVSVTPHIAGLTHADDILEDFMEAWTALSEGRRPRLQVEHGRGY